MIDLYEQQVQAALNEAGNTLSFDDVRRGVSEGRYQFWPDADSVVVTEVLDYPQAKVLHFLLAAGDLPTLERMFPAIEAWGETQGCRYAAATGRRGWERSFMTKHQGWKATHVVLSKELACRASSEYQH